MYRVEHLVNKKERQNILSKLQNKKQISMGEVSPALYLQRNLGNQVMAKLESNGSINLDNGQPEHMTDSTLNSKLHASKSSGESISEPTKTFMEASFGTSLDRVRVHTDSRAEVMSKSLGAEAFTFGRNIYFNAGRYSPETAKGAKLLAHELVHTVQQGFHDSTVPHHIPLSTPGEPAEQQAESISAQLIDNISGKQGGILKNVAGIKTQRIQPKIQMAKNVDVAVYETKDHGTGFEDAPSESFSLKANSIKEAGSNLNKFINSVKKYFGSSTAIKQLSFYGHAAPGDQSVGAGEGQDLAKQITTASINTYTDDFKQIYAPLSNGANVYLRGCNAGAGPQGLALLKKIKSSCKSLAGKDIEAHGWTGKSYHMRRAWYDWWKQTGERVSSSDKLPKLTWEKLKKQTTGKK